MTLTNKRETYDVSNSSSTLKLTGSFTYTLDKLITNFNGVFYKLDDTYTGSFSYYEVNDNTSNKSVNSFPIELQDAGCTLVDETIKAIKLELKA